MCRRRSSTIRMLLNIPLPQCEYFTVWFLGDYCSIFSPSLTRCSLCLSCGCQPQTAVFQLVFSHLAITILLLSAATPCTGSSWKAVDLMLLGFLGTQLLMCWRRDGTIPTTSLAQGGKLSCGEVRETLVSHHLLQSHVLHDLHSVLLCYSPCVIKQLSHKHCWEQLLLHQFQNPQLLPQQERSFNWRITIWYF